MEAIGAGAKVGIDGFAPFHGSYPVAIIAIQFESKTNPIGNGKIQPRKVQGNSLMAGWNVNGGSHAHGDVIRHDGLYMNDNRRLAAVQARRIHHRDGAIH